MIILYQEHTHQVSVVENDEEFGIDFTVFILST